jgi:hypothetical protein
MQKQQGDVKDICDNKAFSEDTNDFNRKIRIKKYAIETGRSKDFVTRYSHIGCVVTRCLTCKPNRGKEVKEKSRAFKYNWLNMEIEDQLDQSDCY